jgi:hypothetical protein
LTLTRTKFEWPQQRGVDVVNKAATVEASLPMFFLAWENQPMANDVALKDLQVAIPSKVVILATINTTAIAAYLSLQYTEIGVKTEIVHVDRAHVDGLKMDSDVTVTDMTIVSLEALDAEISTHILLARWLKIGQQVSAAGINVNACFALHRCLTGIGAKYIDEMTNLPSGAQLHGSMWGLIKSLRVDSRKIFNALCVDVEFNSTDIVQHSAIASALFDEFNAALTTPSRFATAGDVAFRNGGTRQIMKLHKYSDLHDIAANQTAAVDPFGTYVIVGGFGGIGLATAIALKENGVKSIALVSRQGKIAESRHAELDHLWNELTADGCVNVICKAVDVCDAAQVLALFDELQQPEMPALRGVLHAAVIMSGVTPLEDLTSAQLKKATDVKNQGL